MESADPPEEFEGNDIDAETLQAFAEAQKEDAEARQREMQLKEKELEKNERQAKRATEAQLENLSQEREHQNRIHKREQRHGIVIIGFAFLFMGYLVWSGNADMAYEVIKLAVYGGGGWAAGQAYGKAKGQTEQRNGSGQ